MKKFICQLLAIPLLLSLTEWSGFAAEEYAPQLFTEAAATHQAENAQFKAGVDKRKRYTGIDFSRLLTPGQLKKGQAIDLTLAPKEGQPQQITKFELNLFDDVKYILVLERAANESPDGTTITWYGSLEGEIDSKVILVSSDGVLSGNITLADGQSFQIRYRGNGVHVIREIDQSRYGTELEPNPQRLPDDFDPNEDVDQLDSSTPYDTGDEEDPATDPSQYDETGSTIDVMIVYTPAARIANGGTAGMNTLIDLAVAETNTGYANSNVVQRINLVHRQEVTYTESTPPNSSSTIVFDDALDDLEGTSDGQIDIVHSLRNDYAADIVSLFVHDPTTDWCGKSNIMDTESHTFENQAFDVVDWDCATGYYSYAHEMGHNMGSRHDRPHDSSDGVFAYSHGYQDPEEDFRTIMSYNCPGGCDRVNYWSNVNIDYIVGATNYGPTGIIYTAPDSAANWRSLNNVRDTVANWRPRWIYVNGAFVGTEWGLSANPYNTFSEGVSHIGQFATDPRLYITPGTYTGAGMTISKPMTIYNWGTGSIIIQ